MFRKIASDEIQVGEIEENAPYYEGYDYSYAEVNGAEILSVGVYDAEGEDLVYYSIDGEEAELLGENEIILHYVPHREVCAITYVFDESQGTVEGPKEAQAGDEVTFNVSANLGSQIGKVRVNETEVQLDGDNSYTFTLEGETQIEVSFERPDTFDVTYFSLGNSGPICESSICANYRRE